MTVQERLQRLRQGWPREFWPHARYVGYVVRPRPGSAGRFAKVPCRVVGERAYPCDPADRTAHLTFGDALELVERELVYGVGVALSEDLPGVRGLPLTVVDLDDVVHDGVLEERARKIVERLDSLTMISGSGRGLHVVVAARVQGGRLPGLEILTRGHAALTGARLLGTPGGIEARGAELAALREGLVLPQRRARRPSPLPPLASVALADADVLHRARASTRFEVLYDAGDTAPYDNDVSRADLALLRVLTRYTRDPAQLRRLWAASALARGREERWARRASRDGRDYASYSIDRALELAGRSD